MRVKGFGQYEKTFYLYLGKIDDESECQDHLDDLGVALYRTEKKVEELEKRISDSRSKKIRTTAQLRKEEERATLRRLSVPSLSVAPLKRDLERVESEIADTKSKLALTSTIYIGFIMNPKIKAESFVSEAEALLGQYDRYRLCISSHDVISFGDIEVVLSGPAH